MQTGYVLLVDDDPALLLALPQTIHLRLSGVQLETADSAQSALNLLQTKEYDAIISDIKMPGMDGLELMKNVYERFPETPVLLITGHGEHELAIQAIRGGAYDYIQKPIDRDDFTASLERALHTRQLRRQIQEQQHALEDYTLSLERIVERRTREIVETQEADRQVLALVSRELTTFLHHWQNTSQLVMDALEHGENKEQTLLQLAELQRSRQHMELFIQEMQHTNHLLNSTGSRTPFKVYSESGEKSL